MNDTDLMPNVVPLIMTIILSFYLSSNIAITSTIKARGGEKSAENWSDMFLKIYFGSIGLSVLILATMIQFVWGNIFDVIGIVCIILNVILFFKNIRIKDKWSSTILIEDRPWLNSIAVDIPLIYLFGYIPVKLFLLGM